MRILICGLPSAGKTTLAKALAERLGFARFSADDVRSEANDWDFSPYGRERQLKRMVALSRSAENTICDFICPTEKARAEFGADFLILMDTVKSSSYPDTDAIFEKPVLPDLQLSSFEYDINFVVEVIERAGR